MKAHSASFIVSNQDIAYVVFDRQKLVFWEVHSFPCAPPDIARSVIGSVSRCIERFKLAAAVLFQPSAIQSALDLSSTVKEALRSNGIPIFEISEQELLIAFGSPPLEDRLALRRTVAALFAELPFAPYMYPCLDAAALGLHFETSRLLTVNSINE